MTKNYHKLFQEGNQPFSADGFYRGRLVRLYPNSFSEKIASLIAAFWIPWKGKHFNQKAHNGFNVLPVYINFLLKVIFGDRRFIENNINKTQAFPFQTSRTKSVYFDVNVLRLSYQLPENPRRIQEVVDELVELDDNTLLGAAFIVKNKKVRLVAFFLLEKYE